MPSIFHEQAIDIAVNAQRCSAEKYKNAPNDLVRDALFILTHDAVCVHRAVSTLVDAGWSAPAAALFRTLIDMSVSAIALTNSANPRMAAFRYLYSGLRRHSRDQGLPADARRRMFQQIRQRLSQLPPDLHDDAIAVVKDRDRPYWFAPEWSTPAAVIEAFGRDDLRWTYMQASAAAHGTIIGMRLFSDDPDRIDINPRPLGPRGFSLDLASCRWLVEIVRIRDTFEGLDLSTEIDTLVSRISEAVAQLPRA